MNNFYENLALIGAGTVSWGTGLLAFYNSIPLVLTCGHVAGMIERENHQPWFMPDVRAKKGNPRFPIVDIVKDDTGSDLAVCTLDSTSIAGQFMSIEKMIFPGISTGTHIKAIGFPVSYAAQQMSRNQDLPLLPCVLGGIIINEFVPELSLSHPYDNAIKVKICGSTIVKMDITNEGFGGLSGGLITLENYQPIGLIIGEASRGILIFSSIVRVFELLKDTVV